jgi:alkylated DNA repair dioxygenase AlkB
VNLSGFTTHVLEDGRTFIAGRLPERLLLDERQFEQLWSMHPKKRHVIHMVKGPVATPRWQQAYGADYHYTGSVNRAEPVPDSLQPYLSWGCENVHPQLNGILANWYDGSLGHYIGKHRDSTINMIPAAPIVTISFGEERVFRLRPWKGRGYRDFLTQPGGVFVMPFETNLHWTHEVPKSAKHCGQRISITLRAFEAHSTQANERTGEIASKRQGNRKHSDETTSTTLIR